MNDLTTTMDATQKLHFYQKGTFTVGNRLVSDQQRSVQASINRSNALTCGHRVVVVQVRVNVDRGRAQVGCERGPSTHAGLAATASVHGPRRLLHGRLEACA